MQWLPVLLFLCFALVPAGETRASSLEAAPRGQETKQDGRAARETVSPEARTVDTGRVPYNINDIDERAFNRIIDTIAALYRDAFEARGMELVIAKDWAADTESASSWYMEENDRATGEILEVRRIELVGGLARHPMLDRDAYAMIVCHEIGHHLGGAPFALGYSAEGQSDYFASAKCMKRYLRTTDYQTRRMPPVPDELRERCRSSFSAQDGRRICERSIRAGLKMARWIAHSRQVGLPALSKRDGSKRQRTQIHGYPEPQCRLDTLVAGALCPIDAEERFSRDDPDVGACTRKAGYDRGARPRCWYNPEGERLKGQRKRRADRR